MSTSAPAIPTAVNTASDRHSPLIAPLSEASAGAATAAGDGQSLASTVDRLNSISGALLQAPITQCREAAVKQNDLLVRLGNEEAPSPGRSPDTGARTERARLQTPIEPADDCIARLATGDREIAEERGHSEAGARPQGNTARCRRRGEVLEDTKSDMHGTRAKLESRKARTRARFGEVRRGHLDDPAALREHRRAARLNAGAPLDVRTVISGVSANSKSAIAAKF